MVSSGKLLIRYQNQSNVMVCLIHGCVDGDLTYERSNTNMDNIVNICRVKE